MSQTYVCMYYHVNIIYRFWSNVIMRLFAVNRFIASDYHTVAKLNFRETGNVHEAIDSKQRSQSSGEDALGGGETVNQNAKRVCQFYR